MPVFDRIRSHVFSTSPRPPFRSSAARDSRISRVNSRTGHNQQVVPGPDGCRGGAKRLRCGIIESSADPPRRMPKPDDTPLMQQWREAKNRHPDALVFFRVGDFYEMFCEDAEEGARLL